MGKLIKEIVIASHNEGKVKEIRSLYLLQGINLEDITSSEPIENWFTLLSSYNIYATPNSFAFSTKVLNPRSNIFILKIFVRTLYSVSLSNPEVASSNINISGDL